MTKVSASFSSVLHALSSQHTVCPALETLVFQKSTLEAWYRPVADGTVSYENEHENHLSVQSALEQLADAHCPNPQCVYEVGDSEFVKPLQELKLACDKKLFADRLRKVQVFPSGYTHKRLHCMELKYSARAYHCHYTVKDSSQSWECSKDRWFLKLKDVSLRIIRALEAVSTYRLTQSTLTFVYYDGNFLLQNAANTILLPAASFIVEAVRSDPVLAARPRPIEKTVEDVLDVSKDHLNSPLRIRTPAYTCPSSPAHSASSRDSHFPPLSPNPLSRILGRNFKEMVARTVERNRMRRAPGRQRPNVDIDEVVKDDDTFFEYLGVGEGQVDTPTSRNLAGKVLNLSSEPVISLESTTTTASRPRPQPTKTRSLRHLPPVPRSPTLFTKH